MILENIPSSILLTNQPTAEISNDLVDIPDVNQSEFDLLMKNMIQEAESKNTIQEKMPNPSDILLSGFNNQDVQADVEMNPNIQKNVQEEKDPDEMLSENHHAVSDWYPAYQVYAAYRQESIPEAGKSDNTKPDEIPQDSPSLTDNLYGDLPAKMPSKTPIRTEIASLFNQEPDVPAINHEQSLDTDEGSMVKVAVNESQAEIDQQPIKYAAFHEESIASNFFQEIKDKDTHEPIEFSPLLLTTTHDSDPKVMIPSFAANQVTAPKPDTLVKTTPEHPILDKPINFDNSQWQPSFAERIYWMSSNHLNAAKIQIHPQELGPIDVQIQVKDGLTHILLNSDQPVIRQTLEQGIPMLRELFSENGLNLNSIIVNQPNAQEMNFSQQKQASHSPYAMANDTTADQDDVQVHMTELSPEQRLGMVDYYA